MVPKDGKNAEKKAKAEVEELSEEDQKFKEELELLVDVLGEKNTKLYPDALERLKNAIRTSTSSMTAVPKPLKFLRPKYSRVQEIYEKWQQGENKNNLAAILSVLGMAVDGAKDTLKYRLLIDRAEDFGEWGHEYMRHLALEIGEEFHTRIDANAETKDLLDLSLEIVPFFLKHNAEADAVDLLLEVESVEKIVDYVDENTFMRVGRYLVSCAPLMSPPDDEVCLTTAYNIYLQNKRLPDALTLAIRLDDESMVRSVFMATQDQLVRQQLALLVGRQRQWYSFDDAEVQDVVSNTKLNEYFRYLAKELNLEEPKNPQDIYKSYLDTSLLGAASAPDPLKQNMASVFVNGFVNCAYGKDEIIETEPENKSRIYHTKNAGMTCAVASLGLLHMWDVVEGLGILDNYLYSPEEYIKSGALLGVGVVSAGVHDETDPALALLGEYVENQSNPLRTSAIIGLGLAYAGSPRAELSDLLLPLVVDSDLSMEVSSLAALALGLIFVGTANGDITTSIMQALLERSSVELSDKWARFMVLGLGLLYVGKAEETEEIIETIKVIEHPIALMLEVLITICSYCGSGNVLQIQKLLRECSTRPYEDEDDEEDDEEDDDGALDHADAGTTAESSDSDGNDDTEMHDAPDTAAESNSINTETETSERQYQKGENRQEAANVKAFCVLGIALIAMGEEIGSEMVMRHFGHLMHYGDAPIRRAVPLAMGLVSTSNPEMKVYETLSRYSHDSDLEVASNAVFAMGLVGSGTNNARIAQLLRQLAVYYSRDPDSLFMVRIAQGLLHLGKGTLTLTPFNTERLNMSRVALGGLLTVAVALLTPKSFILSQSPQMLYFLTLAIQPRMLVTVDENMEPIKVNVRVGQAVDVVGQVGNRKTITGWVTHTTPVLLAVGERAELEDEEYLPLTSTLEGVVILKKNPDFEAN